MNWEQVKISHGGNSHENHKLKKKKREKENLFKRRVRKNIHFRKLKENGKLAKEVSKLFKACKEVINNAKP